MGNYAIGVMGHGGGGKTSLVEAMLLVSGQIPKLGSVEAGTSVMDFEAEEKERKFGIHSALAFLEWDGQQVDLVDTPGSMNFIGATAGAARVVDGAVLVSSAEPGIQGQTEQIWEYLERYAVPRLMVINQMDKEQANFRERLDFLNGVFSNRLVPLNFPIGKGEGFQGLVDLIEMRAYAYDGSGKAEKGEIPAELQAEAEAYRTRLVEGAAEGEEELLEKYLETESLEPEEILRGLKAATQTGNLVPVLCAASARNVGTDRILGAVTSLLPDAATRVAQRREGDSAPPGYVGDFAENASFSAQVFKTKIDHYAGKLSIIRVRTGELHPAEEIFNSSTSESERPAHLFKLLGKEQKEVKVLRPGEFGALPKLNHTASGHTLCAAKKKVEFAPIEFPQPVLSYALKLHGKGEEEKLSAALHRMMDEDSTLAFTHSVETGNLLVGGMGQIHLDLVLERLKKEFNLDAEYELPKVPYRETIRVSAKAQGKYKKQTGGRGQYGDCWIELKPNGREEKLNFRSAVVGGAIPRNFIPAVEKGIVDAMVKGGIAGFRVIGIEAIVYDGTYHDVDSSEMAFKIAGSMAFKKAMEGARPTLLEPMMELEIVVHADYMGDVMGDINSRRGKVLGMDTRGRNQVVRAEVPMGEALTYAIDLRAMTSGQGYFTQKFARYEEAPPQVSEKVIKARQAAAQG
ncbi:MAG: elongation factor G [SAR324 cluster bacterium]|nr:elongation factor G [SAR324 cluster bacterium]